MDATGSRGSHRALAWALIVLAFIEALVAVVGPVALGMSFADTVGAYVVTNVAIGGSLAAAGGIIALHRARHPVGWLLLAGGICHLTTAAATAIGAYGNTHEWPEPAMRTLSTFFSFSWPWGICLALPVALQLFPTGRPVSRRWRPAVWFTVVAGVLFVAYTALDPAFPGQPIGDWRSYLGLPFYHRLDPLWTLANFLPLLSLITAIAGLVVRYRRGDEILRRQLLWLVLGSIAAVALNLPRWIVGYAPILLLLTVALVPAAIAIAILRYQLLDIRLVLSRTVVYLLLTLGVIGAYLGGVAAIDSLARGVGAPVFTTLAIALAFNPVRVRLQRVVDRRLYGARHDPYGAVSEVGARLAADDLTGVLDGTRSALRLPFAALRHDGKEVAASGTPPTLLHVVALEFRGRTVGELVVGVRGGERRMATADLAVLDLLATPLASALYATGLAEEVQASRERIVAAREEERRRLHRDLHDGLGPTLTGAGFKADAAHNLVTASPEQARELLIAVRADIGQAIADVRRVVYELRPPALDELGLPGALSRHGSGLPVQVTVAAPVPMPPLPAAVEVAAYRIATEALTNVARHSGALTAHVEVAVDTALHLSIRDDGPNPTAWRPGVGLTSIRDRAAELGGTCAAGPTALGGLVTAVLPLEGVR